MKKTTKKLLHRVASWVLALCMCLSLVPAQAGAAEDVVLFYEGQPGYVRCGETLRGEITVTLDATWFGFGGTTDAVTIGDPTKIAAFNSASLSVAGSDPSVFNPNIDPPRFAWGSVAQGVHECTLYVTMEKVTGDPQITLAPLNDTSTEHYKADSRDWQFVTPAMTKAGGPEVHLVYDLDVTAGANGTVSFDAGRYYSGTDIDILDYWQDQGMTLIEATAMLGEGKNIFDRDDSSTDYSAGITDTTAATAQWATGEDLVFTVTPDANYEVAAASATLAGKDVSDYLTDNGDGTYTLNLPENELSYEEDANGNVISHDDVAVSFTFTQQGENPAYKVEHYVQTLDESNYELVYTETKNDVAANKEATGKYLTVPIAAATEGLAANYAATGFDFVGVSQTKTADTVESVRVDGKQGSIKLYYTRKTFNLTVIGNDGTKATVMGGANTQETVTRKYGEALSATARHEDPDKVLDGWYTTAAGTGDKASDTMPARNYSIFAKWKTATDPIRPYDPADPTDKNPPDPDGWLVPGENGTDENGGGDDQIIIPNEPDPNRPDEQPTVNADGELELPDGGQYDTDDDGIGDGEQIPPSVIDGKGETVAYLFYVRLLQDATNAAIPAPAGFATKVVVPVNQKSYTVVAPTITNYTFVRAEPTNLTFTADEMQQATAKLEMRIYYKTNNVDPIRPYDPADPADKNPADPDGWLIPGENDIDEDGGGDDKIIIPNEPDPNRPDEQPTVNADGDLELPDGGQYDTDGDGIGDGEQIPPSVIDGKGDTVAYLFYVRLLQEGTNAAIAAPTGFATKVVVPVNQKSYTVVAPTIANYTFVRAEPANLTFTDAELKQATAKLEMMLYYKANNADPIRPYDPADPTNKNPADPDGWLIPGENGTDENGDGDDKIIIPNEPDPNRPDEQPTVNAGGELELPDGGQYDTNKDGIGDGEQIPPSVIDGKGDTVAYLFYVRLLQDGTGTDIPAPAGFATKVRVPVNQASHTVVAPTIANYTFASADPANLTFTTAELKQATAKLEMKIYYTSNAANDPIRPYDPADPADKNPADPDGWLIPGTNGTDENGSGDDKIIIPNGDDSRLEDEELYLPDGGQYDTDGDGIGDGDNVPPSVVDNKGNIVAYLGYVMLEDELGAALTAPSGYATEVRVPVNEDFSTYAPFVKGYVFLSGNPADLIIPNADLQTAATRNIITLTYRDATAIDPIRPFDPTDPTNKNPDTPEGWLVPGSNGMDENGDLNTDDLIVYPNDDAAGNDNSTLNGDGNLELPEGGFIDKDGDGKLTPGVDEELPPVMIDPLGNMYYIVTVELIEKGSDPENQLTASTTFASTVYVTAGTNFNITAPDVLDYTYASESDPVLPIDASDLADPAYFCPTAGEAPYRTVKLYYVPASATQATITFRVQNGTWADGTTADITHTIVLVNGVGTLDAALVPTGMKANSGYTNGHWLTTPDTTADAVTGNVQYVYYFDRTGGDGNRTTNYALTFETNGGTAVAAVTKSSGTTITLSEYETTKPGNTFLGWYATNDAAKNAAATGDTSAALKTVRLTANTTVYAGWSGLTEDHIAYIVGYPNGQFQPEQSITRAEAATLFYRLLSDKTYSGGGVAFRDVASNAWYAQAVQVLAGKGLITGYSDGTFKPNANITRAEFATIASRFENLTESTITFNDVPTTHWAYRYISSAATKGWIEGAGNGLFRPDENIKRVDVVSLVNKVLMRTADQTFIAAHLSEMTTFSDVPSSHWGYYPILEASNAHNYVKNEETNVETSWTELKK